MTKKTFLLMAFIGCLTAALQARTIKKQVSDLTETAKEKVKEGARKVKETVEDIVGNIKEATDKTFDNIVSQATAPVIVYAYSKSIQTPLAEHLQATFKSLARNHSDQFHFISIDIDKAPFVKKRYKINKFPAIIVIKGTTVYASFSDYSTTEDVAREIQQSLTRRLINR